MLVKVFEICLNADLSCIRIVRDAVDDADAWNQFTAQYFKHPLIQPSREDYTIREIANAARDWNPHLVTKLQVARALLVCCEMHTPNGARETLPAWAKDEAGDPNYTLIAYEARRKILARR